MKITFVNQYYKPLNNPPAKRLSAFAEYFVKKKWDVKVVTGQPNYPTGKLVKGYNWFWKKENINGVKVYRFPEIPMKNEGVIKRIFSYGFFAFSSFFSFPIIFKSDIVFISSPPLSSIMPAYWYARLFKKKIIFDVRDLWPESIAEVVNVKKGLMYKILFSVARDIYKNADLIFAVTAEMTKNISDRGFRKAQLLTNFSKKKKIIKKKDSKKIKIVYTGVITKAQNLNLLLKANLDKKVYDKFEWHIAGIGDDFKSLKDFVKKHKFKNVFLYGYREKSFCDKIIQEGDLGLAPLGETKTFRMALPSKALDYLSYGKPILVSWSTEMKSIIDKNDCGYFVPTIKKGFKETLLAITKEDLAKKSKNAHKLFLKRFEENAVCKKMFECVERMK